MRVTQGVSDSLAVYDIAGRKLMVSVNERKDAGTYEARFHGARLTNGGVFLESTTVKFHSDEVTPSPEFNPKEVQPHFFNLGPSRRRSGFCIAVAFLRSAQSSRISNLLTKP